MSNLKAILALEDGTIFEGRSIGASGKTNGEIVFNTSMTGYQEILTDPSYAKQIVTLTYPHIGNTGINHEDVESDAVWCAGLVIRSNTILQSSWRSENSLTDYLKANSILGISDIDTRKLTRLIRTKGAQAASILVSEDINKDEDLAKLIKSEKDTLEKNEKIDNASSSVENYLQRNLVSYEESGASTDDSFKEKIKTEIKNIADWTEDRTFNGVPEFEEFIIVVII